MHVLLRISAVAGLLGFGACAPMSPVDSGFVTKQQETSVRVGMSTDEVRKALGTPFNTVQYRNDPQPTWVYRAPSTLSTEVLFYVEFGAEGRVRALSEQQTLRVQRP